MRRIRRDVNERGRSMDSVMAQYQKTVRPMFLQFIEPSKQYADIIVPRRREKPHRDRYIESENKSVL